MKSYTEQEILEGYKHKDIANILSIPVGTSKWLLSNTKNRLKKMLINSDSNYSGIINRVLASTLRKI